MAAKKINGRNLSLLFDGTTEFAADGTNVVLDNEDADTDSQTFEELSEGTAVQWFFTITARSDFSADSFWTLLWENAGDTVPFVFKPEGNPAASAEQPHFTGTATILRKPAVGGPAGTNWTDEARLDVDGEPVRVIA
jgi:hypothetical protein